MGVLASGQADLTVGGDQMDPIYRVEFTEGHQQFFRKNVNRAERAPLWRLNDWPAEGALGTAFALSVFYS